MPVASFLTYLGYGLLRPFQRDKKSDFINGGGLTLIKACVGQIIGTNCSDETGVTQGEVPWRPEFGSLLFRTKHMKGIARDELARVYVIDALSRWEPRVSVTSASTDFDPLSRIFTIHLVYDVIEQNVSGNNVLLQDVEQSVSIAA